MADILHQVIILDQSKSMREQKALSIENYNKKISDLKLLSGIEVYITVLVFHEFFTFLYQKSPLKDIVELKDADYTPDGMTMYNDAIYKAIDYIDKSVIDTTNTSYSMYIISDKLENKSQDKTSADITTLITDKESTGKWQFEYTEAVK